MTLQIRAITIIVSIEAECIIQEIIGVFNYGKV